MNDEIRQQNNLINKFQFPFLIFPFQSSFPYWRCCVAFDTLQLYIQQMNEILDAMFEKKVQPEDVIIRQGDDGDNFYVIES